MRDASKSDESRLIAELNDLLQLDHDAVEAYTIAIDSARDATIRETLVGFRADHKRHIEELAALVRDRGGLPTELPHATAPLKLAVQALGAALGDDALLLAFKAVEGQGRDRYRRARDQEHPAEVHDVIARAADDEERHYRWVEETLRERGMGEGTLPHRLAGVVEAVHKAIADPVERAGREVMERIGEIVGTARDRGASPEPMAAGGERRDDDEDRGEGTGRSGLVDPSGRPL